MFALMMDLRQAIRALARRPAFSMVAILTLALGIGANTAMFSAVYHTLIQPLPFEAAERLANVYQVPDNSEKASLMINPPSEYVDAWRWQTLQTIEHFSAYSQGQYSVMLDDEPEAVDGVAIEPGLLPLLRLRPVLGRNFVAADLVNAASDVALITEGMWKRRFGSSRHVLGSKIMLNEKSHEIVGVLPGEVTALSQSVRDAQVFVPLRQIPGQRIFSSTIVRLRDGATFEQASAEFQSRSAGVKLEHVLDGKWVIRVMPAAESIGEGTEKGFTILLAAVGLVLLIACANLAGLLLVRLAARRREIAIRAALGAGRFNIIRNLWAESLALAVLGGLTGVLMAGWAIDFVRSLRPDSLQSLDAIVLNVPSMLFAGGLVALTAVLFGLIPLVSIGRRDLTAEISAGAGARVTEAGRLRAVLVTGEIAVSVVLLIGAALLVRSVKELQNQPLGFDRDGVVMARIQLPDARYPTDTARIGLANEVLAHVRALPGVRSATMASSIPPDMGMMFVGEVVVEGDPNAGAKVGTALSGGLVDPNFYETLGIRIVSGRTWQASEKNGIIINQTMAKMLWPGQEAVGRRVKMSNRPEAPWEAVLAVVEDVASHSLKANARPQLYNRLPYMWGEMTVAVRVKQGDPLALVGPLKQIMKQVDAAVPLRDIATLESKVAHTIARERFSMALLSGFAALAVILALVGLYGVISTMVSRRAHEIGVRLALGASPAAVRAMVLREGMVLTAIGLTVGAAAAIALVKVLKSFLFGVSPTDPLSFAAALVLIGAGALFATWLPARRATLVDPLVVMRAE